ncbi:MAG: 3-dehydroquinate synthase [Phenylobacterium sp.]|jgi:3-dehydroquinate synthase
MHSATRSGSRLVYLFTTVLVTVMLVIMAVFVLFEQHSTEWINTVGQNLTSSGGIWLLALFLIAVLALDTVLPIPSSIVAVFAATTLGFWGGALTIWLGLMLSCCCGYLIGAGSERMFVRRWIDQNDLDKARVFASKVGPGALVALRGVPILAETSVIAAGLVRYPLWPFMLICALANTGLAAAYGYVGAKAGAQSSLLLVIGGSIAVPAFAWLLKLVWQRFSGSGSTSPASTSLASTSKGITAIQTIHAEFKLAHHYPVLFENKVFNPTNPALRNVLSPQCPQSPVKQNVFIYIDEGVIQGNPALCDDIKGYFAHHSAALNLMANPEMIVGGEAAKQPEQIERIYQQLLNHKVDRHCCVITIGGGAVLDAVGYACTTFHRGLKFLRMPSTVLAQNDAGVGVKNGINLFNTKNLIGTFSTPLAVLNDASLLQTLSVRDRRAGLAEAVKVAAIRDGEFFQWMVSNAGALSRFEDEASGYAIYRCAQLHLNQITGAGDPFESGSARPLDYGHWSAHKLEAIANYTIRHGEAVAIGMALDARYAANIGFLAEDKALQLIGLLENLGFELWHQGLEQQDDQGAPLVFAGLEEFRQHLGGELCITLLSDIGIGKEVNTLNNSDLLDALAWLKQRALTVKADLLESITSKTKAHQE